MECVSGIGYGVDGERQVFLHLRAVCVYLAGGIGDGECAVGGGKNVEICIVAALVDTAVRGSPFAIDGDGCVGTVGVIGVLGPRRMNYKQVLQTLGDIGGSISQMMEEDKQLPHGNTKKGDNDGGN